MSMNVYDEAHKLSSAIKESNEYVDYERLKRLVDEDANLSSMLQELHELQISIQAAQITGQAADPNLMSRMQSVYTMLSTNSIAAEYLQAEMRLSVMIKDVFEILGDSINFMTK